MAGDKDRVRFRYERDVQAAFEELARFVGQILQRPSLCHRCRRALLGLQDALVRLPFVQPGFGSNLRVLVPDKTCDRLCELSFTDVEIVLAAGGCHHDDFFGDDPYSTDLFYLARTGCRRADGDGIRAWLGEARRLACPRATITASASTQLRSGPAG